MSARKSQLWTGDFIMGFTIFTVTLVLVLKLIFNTFPSESATLVFTDGEELSAQLITRGYPSNWTNETVIIPGLVDNYRLNESKLSEFRDIEYYRSKTLLSIKSDYVFFFMQNGTLLEINGESSWGSTAVLIENSSVSISEQYSNLAKVERYVLYNSKIISMIIYAWN